MRRSQPRGRRWMLFKLHDRAQLDMPLSRIRVLNTRVVLIKTQQLLFQKRPKKSDARARIFRIKLPFPVEQRKISTVSISLLQHKGTWRVSRSTNPAPKQNTGNKFVGRLMQRRHSNYSRFPKRTSALHQHPPPATTSATKGRARKVFSRRTAESGGRCATEMPPEWD
jgi:hypothetical protein